METIGTVRIETKSNYRNLNGTTQNVIEYIPNSRVSCLIEIDGKMQTVDFGPDECFFIN